MSTFYLSFIPFILCCGIVGGSNVYGISQINKIRNERSGKNKKKEGTLEQRVEAFELKKNKKPEKIKEIDLSKEKSQLESQLEEINKKLDAIEAEFEENKIDYNTYQKKTNKLFNLQDKIKNKYEKLKQ